MQFLKRHNMNKHKILCVISIVFMSWSGTHVIQQYPNFVQLGMQKAGADATLSYNQAVAVDNMLDVEGFRAYWNSNGRDPFHLHKIQKTSTPKPRPKPRTPRRPVPKPAPKPVPAPAPKTGPKQDQPAALPFVFRGIIRADNEGGVRKLVVEEMANGKYHEAGVGDDLLGARVIKITSTSAIVETDKGERFELLDYIRTYYGK